MDKDRLLNLGNKSNKTYKWSERLLIAFSAIVKKYSSQSAFLILFTALIALSCSPIFTKLSEAEISPSATLFNRLWISTIILTGFTSWQQGGDFLRSQDTPDVNLIPSPRNYKQQGLLILASLAATASALCWAYSLTQTSVASSTVIRSLTPIFIAAGSWLIFRQKCDRKFLAGMAISIMGGITIGWDDLQLGREYLIGDGVALLSAALHGVNLLVAGYLRDRLDTVTILLWRCACGALVILPLVWFTEIAIFPLSATGWLLVIALAIVCQTFGQGLLVYSLKQFSSSFVGVFMLLKPIVSALLAWVIFAEGINLINGAAVILILWGIYLAKSSKSSEKTA